MRREPVPRLSSKERRQASDTETTKTALARAASWILDRLDNRQDDKEILDRAKVQLTDFAQFIYQNTRSQAERQDLVDDFVQQWQVDVDPETGRPIIYHHTEDPNTPNFKGNIRSNLDLSVQDLRGELKIPEGLTVRRLDLSDNQIDRIDASGANISSLLCNDNELRELDVSRIDSLTNLNCSNNQIEELDVSRMNDLSTLDCSRNRLERLELPREQRTGNGNINCSRNRLGTLDVAGLYHYSRLDCSHNKLRQLDLSEIEGSLWHLDCSYNRLESIKPPREAIMKLDCLYNRLSPTEINNIRRWTALKFDGLDTSHFIWKPE